MTMIWNWPGSRWWRFDLHAHSPCSYDFKPEADREAKDWSAWIAGANSASLAAVAITDHNTSEGIAGLQEAARLAGGPVVFPGVEVTVGGVHLLCVFDPSATRDDVLALLVQLGIDPRAQGLRETAATKSILEAIPLAAKSGALVIAAHVNGPKGLLLLEGQDRLKALESRGLAAAEVCPLVASSEGLVRDPTSPDVQDWLNGTKTGRKLTQVWSSDAHRHSDFGRQFTWLKMTRPDLEGLRLALLDGDGSVRSKDGAADPNRHASYLIEAITVSKAKYMGRLQPLEVQFNPWLNAIIGGRGTGKSTLVDFMRSALGREDELATGGETALRAAFDKRMRVPNSRTDEGLLLAETAIEIIYRKDGERFRIAWTNGRSATISRFEGDQLVDEQGIVRERFPIRIYSQKQLFDLARNPNALLEVIDDTDDLRGANLGRLLEEIAARFLSLRAGARAQRARAAELAGRSAELGDLRRKIELLQSGENAELLADYRRSRERQSRWTTAKKDLAEKLSTLEKVVASPMLERGEAASDPAGVALASLHAELKAIAVELDSAVESAVGRARERVDQLLNGADANRWDAAVEAIAVQYEVLTRQLAAAGIGAADEYGTLLERAGTLGEQVAALERAHEEAQFQEQQADAELARYRATRSELTRRRAAFAAKSSSELIRVEIRPGMDRERLEEFVRETLGIARFDDDLRTLALSAAPPNDAGWSHDMLDQVVDELRKFLADPQRSWGVAKDKRFESALRKVQPERIDRLALYQPEDGVDVSFRDPRDQAGNWRKLAQGSPGQQTAALLAFVLGYGGEPIVLDQPEDDLDNTLIYELLVRRLRETKPARQVIVVTHNPNIVVHGDADLVVSLAARSGQTQIAFLGGLQEDKAREEICRVMEGGRDAFETRYRRIMSPG